DAIVNQSIPCIYCSIAQRHDNVARVLERLHASGAMQHTCVVVAEPDDPAGLQFVAPYAATAIAEHFMEQGQDVLIVYDDLTRHAQAYRTLSLLLRRPPGREAYPGDIFYLHSRLLERATHRLAGGSLTALPIIELEGGDMAAYIPTNLISITDGQIVLSPELFGKGILPAVDVAASVSRIGGDAQPVAWRAVTGELRIAYATFLELETFSRFDTRQSEATRQVLQRGRRLREALKQDETELMPAGAQIAVLLGTISGALDAVPLERMHEAEQAIAEVAASLDANQPLDKASWLAAINRASEVFRV
ncbi:MAG: F0F1 ATP synthase subunit alpha, partial [Candidatus Xenobia bacterium]